MSKITVCKTFSFSAAHYLPEYCGACKDLHGHNWKLEVGVTGPITSSGFILDFKELKSLINAVVINRIDHKCLNNLVISKFPSKNPTAENMLLWMAEVIKIRIMNSHYNLAFLKLWETDTSYAEWRNE
jgi:6-pyruvoyltetrahydropterin/6-carboxytetrahydropterin synthase